MEIRIYDPPEAGSPRFRPQGLVTAASSIDVTERLWTAGHFTIEVPLGARHADRLTAGRLVRIADPEEPEAVFWGILDGISMEASSEGQALTASGRQLKGIAGDRITLPPAATDVVGAQGYDARKGTTEAIMKHFVSVNLGPEALVAARRVYGLVLAEDRGRGLPDDKYMSRHEVLSDVLSALGETAGLGWDIVPDLSAGTLVFDVIQGEDHSACQSERGRVVFDTARRTAQSQTYTREAGDSRNLFYATLSGSEFADETLTASYVREGEEEPAGIRRREIHLSVSVSTPAAGTEYDEMRRQVLAQAEGFKPAESFTCQILGGGRIVYGRDWRLGDIVTCRSGDWGVELHPRLTEMQTVWNSSGRSRTATFGTAALNVFGRLRRDIKQAR